MVISANWFLSQKTVFSLFIQNKYREEEKTKNKQSNEEAGTSFLLRQRKKRKEKPHISTVLQVVASLNWSLKQVTSDLVKTLYCLLLQRVTT